MSKKSKRLNRRFRHGRKATATYKLPFKKILAIALTVFGVVGTYITVFGFWMPRISVQPYLALDPKNASSMNFSVTNQGYLNIYKIAIGCRPRNVEQRLDLNTQIVELVPFDSMFESIAPMKSATVQCDTLTVRNDLDVDIVVHYRPAFYPFEQQESFRFTSKVANDGQVHWLPRPDADSWFFPGPPQMIFTYSAI